jgi:hypothetical protein
MSTAGNESMHEGVTAHGRRVALTAASLGLLFCATVSAAEPLVIVKYQSAFADYHQFDAQAPAVAWRQANDAIGSGSEGAAHGMHNPTEPPPADTTESQPTTSGDHREHRQ